MININFYNSFISYGRGNSYYNKTVINIFTFFSYTIFFFIRLSWKTIFNYLFVMPQLVPFFFVNQVVFAFTIFVVLVYVFSKYILPRFVRLFATRLFISKL